MAEWLPWLSAPLTAAIGLVVWLFRGRHDVALVDANTAATYATAAETATRRAEEAWKRTDDIQGCIDRLEDRVAAAERTTAECLSAHEECLERLREHEDHKHGAERPDRA